MSAAVTGPTRAGGAIFGGRVGIFGPAARPISPGLRRLALTAHVAVSVGWIGLEAALLGLAITGRVTNDPETFKAAYIAMGIFGRFFYVPVALAALLTGILSSVGTKYGLLQWWWVAVKFVMTVALTAGGGLIVIERMQTAADRVSGVPAASIGPATVGGAGPMLVGALSVGMVLLVTMTVLSEYKPWGKLPFARRRTQRIGRVGR